MFAKTVCSSILFMFATLAAGGADVSLDYRRPRQTAARYAQVSAAAVGGIVRETRLDSSAAPSLVRALAVGDRLSVRLFDDVELELRLVETTSAPLGGNAFLAEASGHQGMRDAVVVQKPEGLQIDVQDIHTGRAYTVFSSSDGVTVREMNMTSVSCPCGDTLKSPRTRSAAAPSASAAAGARVRASVASSPSQTYVDVLVAYDTMASAYVAQSGGNITNFAEVAVQRMNNAIANTGLDSSFRFRLVGVFPAEGNAAGNLDGVLNSIVIPNDTLNGYDWSVLDDVRDECSADVVCVLVDNYSAYGTTGLGFSLDQDTIDRFDDAFSVCLVRAVESGDTMTHEVGHNMGAGHADAMADAASRGPQLYEYSSGYYFTANGRDYHTIMAYDADGYGNYYTGVPYFSSPAHAFEGVPVGDATHDNSRTLRETFSLVSGFRRAPVKKSEIGLGVDAEKYLWMTSGTYPWSIDYGTSNGDGDSARSCEMLGGTTSWTSTTVHGPAKLKFSYRLRTYGGTFSVTCDGDALLERSGEIDYGWTWQKANLQIPEGVHTVRLSYTHPSQGFTDGGNGVWVDSLSFVGGRPASWYTVTFHRNDGSGEALSTQDMESGETVRLPSLANGLGWARRGFTFKGWGQSANTKTVWQKDGAAVKDLADPGGSIDLYAVWEISPGCYALHYIRNDGAGTWRKIGFRYGEKTRMPSLTNGLGWARRGYDFMGWELTTAAANDNTRAAPWKGDWAYVAEPVKSGQTLPVYARWALKPGYYQIRFNKNDGTGKWRTLGFEIGASTKLSTIAGLGWERPGYTFVGWASNAANAAAGKVWKTDGEWVKNAAAEGRTLSIYAIWE